jgi:L,D-transpeptidase ErfK/SrfK
MIKRLIFLSFFIFVPSFSAGSGAYPYQMPKGQKDHKALTIIGVIQSHQIKNGETMLDIARHYDLGYQELMLVYPKIDPWLPPKGKTIMIPTQWVLPLYWKEGIVINVAELRLFFYLPKMGLVKTYPIGIGVEENPTPIGDFKIISKEIDPIWEIPSSLQKEYGGRKIILPGPENPLGSFWLGLSADSYGIHGTNKPWGVGRLVSHGCIRLYPEDIIKLFPLVRIGMPVKIIYQPIKFGFKNNKIYLEAHPDIYKQIPNIKETVLKEIINLGLKEKVKLPSLFKALKEQKGIPLNITQ